MSDDLDLRAVHQRHEPDPEYRAALRARVAQIVSRDRPARDPSAHSDPGGSVVDVIELEPAPRLTSRRRLRAALLVAVAAAAVALTVVAVRNIPSDESMAPSDGSTAPAPKVNGWVALASSRSGGGDISLVRPGEDARRLDVAGSDTAAEACPAWSPDGTRLLFGRLTGSSDTTLSDPELVIVPVGRDSAAGTPTVIALDGFDALEGFDAHPCGTWAPDGRWVALRGPGDVWVVDTQTGEIRRLPDLRPIDLEWRPGTDQLAIAGDMGMTRAAKGVSTPVTVYSVSTGELRHLGSIRAGHLTWSPDGSTLAYTGVYEPPDEGDPDGLWLVDADGTNERVLVADNGRAIHGIGPVWSPTGDRIAYQRIISAALSERHEVVLVSVADGTETVIEPPQADESDEMVRWYPFTVSWSPDGATLLYAAWRSSVGADREVDGRAHLIAVSADTPSDVTVLTLGGVGLYTDHQWVVSQMWGRQPG